MAQPFSRRSASQLMAPQSPDAHCRSSVPYMHTPLSLLLPLLPGRGIACGGLPSMAEGSVVRGADAPRPECAHAGRHQC